jgi:osmoprotectant transport system permease protein
MRLPAAAAVVLALLIAFMPATAPLFAWWFPAIEPPVFQRTSFAALFLAHAVLVALSSLVSLVLGLGLAIVATRVRGRGLRAMIEAVATIGQSFPPVAVLAVAVPALGYGARPTVVALVLYGILPILATAIAALDGVPAAVREAADGMGLTGFQRLLQVELPLAAPTMLAGIRTSVIINIGTATIGSSVGAETLGTPIIEGLVAGKPPYVIEGAVVVALFAILVDLCFGYLDRRLRIVTVLS